MKKALMLGVLGSLIAQGSNSMDLRHSNEKTMMAMRQNMHCNQPAKEVITDIRIPLSIN